MLINCPECNHQISDKAKVCPNCGFPVSIENHCNINGADYDLTEILDLIHKGEDPVICIRQITGMQYLDAQQLYIIIKNNNRIPENYTPQHSDVTPRDSISSKPKCPYCKSYNIKRLDVIDRGLSIGLVGFASNKIGKSYQCKACKGTW